MKWNLPLAAIATASTLLLAGCGSSSSGADSDAPIKVGVAGPMGHQFGEWQKEAVEVAAAKINADGGMGGRQVELVFADTEANPTRAVTEFTRLVKQEKVEFIVGPSTSAETLAAAPLVNQAKIASMPSAGSEDLTPQSLPYGFGVLATSTQQVDKIIESIQQKGYKRIAVIHDDGVLAVEATAQIKDAVESDGLEFVGDQTYKLSTTDVVPQILALRKQNPDLLIAWTTTGQDTGRILQARDQNKWDIPIMGNTGVTAVNEAKAIAGPNSFDNVTALAPAAFAACSVEEIRPNTAEFIEASLEETGAKDGELFLFYMSYFYDGLIWLDAAVDALGTTDGDKVAAWIEKNGAGAADSLPLVGIGWGMSDKSHHAFTADSVALVEPGTQLSEGVFKSAICN